jgi:hypothetical protein
MSEESDKTCICEDQRGRMAWSEYRSWNCPKHGQIVVDTRSFGSVCWPQWQPQPFTPKYP